MANIGQNLKNAMVKSMEAIGNTASNIASNTKYKVTEMNLISKRREILSDFATKAYTIWQAGEEKFPEELDHQLTELYHVDEQLNALRMEHLSNVETKEKTEADQAADQSEKAEAAPAADKDEQVQAAEEAEKPVETEETASEKPEAAEPAEAEA